MAETASLKRPVDEPEDTKEIPKDTNGAESTVRSSCLTVSRACKIGRHCEFNSLFVESRIRSYKLGK